MATIAPQDHGIILERSGRLELDQIVAQNLAARSVLKFAHDAETQVVLGACDPKDFAQG